MSVSKPHFLLYSTTKRAREAPGCERYSDRDDCDGSWEFVVESMDGKRRVRVADREQSVSGQRLELLAVVRGLESLDQPSRVTLMTSSTYVTRGMRFGLAQWREDGWQWESFGRMVPVRNADLWRRLDGALQIHRVRCRAWRIDEAHRHAGIPANHMARVRSLKPTPRTDPPPRLRGESTERRSTLLTRSAGWIQRLFAAPRLCAD